MQVNKKLMNQTMKEQLEDDGDIPVEQRVGKPFLVRHKETGEELWATKEIEGGFLHEVPGYPVVGASGPPAYRLKEPFWEKVC